MKQGLLAVFIISSVSLNATTTVTVASVTAMQAVLEVDTTSGQAACTYEVSENSAFAPPVHDVDTTLFPASNVDIAGSGTFTEGHRVFVAGKRRVDTAVNGRRYSRALQANTTHYYRVTCSSDVIAGQFTTVNPPLGNSYPELPQSDPTAFGNLADPTIDWLDRSQAYIDPLTGIRLLRATGPGESGSVVPGNGFDYALDRSGSWSNPTAALGKSGAFASTTATNAPLFLAWSEIHNFQLTWAGANFNPFAGSVDDIALRLTGSGGGSLSACISLDSGQTCAGSAVPVRLPSSTGAASAAPSSFPSPMFAGWGRAFSDWDISNKSGPNGINANAGSRTVTAPTASFNVDWPAGVKIKITGSGCNGNDVCTLASVQSSGQLTTVETIPNQVSNQSWQAYAAGIRLTLTSGQANLNATFDYAQSKQSLMGDNVNQLFCSPLQVTDINKDKDGNPLSSSLTGRLCNFPNGLYLLVDSTGEFRLLSNFFMNSHSPLPNSPVNVPSTGAFSATDAKTFYGYVYYKDGLYQGTYSGDYTSYKAGGATGYVASGVFTDDAVTWTNVMTGAADVAVQFPQTPGAAQYYNTGMFGTPAFQSILGGYGEYFVSTLSGTDRLCATVRYNFATQSIQQVLTSWSTWPLRWGGCHFSANGGGTFQIGVFNTIKNRSAEVPLGGPFQLKLTQVKKNGIWNNNTALTESNVSAASNTAPVIIATTNSSTDIGSGSNSHGFLDGEPVVVFGATSNTAINSPANSTFFVKVSYSDTSLSSPMSASDTNASIVDGTRVFGTNPLLQIESEFMRCSVVNANGLSGCTRGAAGSTAAAHPASALVRQANSFALYQDAGLTQPVSGNGVFFDNSLTYVMDLDVCPTGLDPRWTTNMIYDSTGASGRRCNTVRVAGEPVNLYAFWTRFPMGSGLTNITVSGGVATVKLTGAFTQWQSGQSITIAGSTTASLNGTFSIANIVNPTTITVTTPGVPNGVHTDPNLVLSHPTEHYAFPFKGDPTNLTTASFQDLQEGDFINDLNSIPYSEQMVVVQKKKNSDTDIELTIMRYWGDQIFCDAHARFSGALVHTNGWSPVMVPNYGCSSPLAYADITDSTWRIGDTRVIAGHYDLAPGSIPGTFTYVPGGGLSALTNVPFSQIMTTPPTAGIVNELPHFAGSTAGLSDVNALQSYPAYRQVNAPASEKVWKSDFRALNPAFGSAQDSPVGLVGGMNLVSIRGTQYDGSSQTTTVYRVAGMASGVDRKHLPIMGFAGYHYITEMSGPGSAITDATPYRVCFADFAGECRPNSNAGDVFASLPGMDSGNGNCFTNGYEYNIPCIFSANSLGGWAIQQQIDPQDTNASKNRRLTMGLMNPGRHFTFTNWLATPDAQWGLLSPPYINGVRNDIFAMKLPPWPGSDGIDRSNFVPLSLPVLPIPNATSARAMFGYAENGPLDSFFCGARKEACTTAGTPYAWLSEPQQPTVCHAGCAIQIPAIAGRVVYYRIDWLDGAGNIVFSSPIDAAVAAP